MSKAIAGGAAFASSANRAVSSGLTSCPTSRAPMASRRWRRASEASAPSAATTRPSSPATASDSGVPASGRGSSTTSATPTATCSRSHGSRVATRSASASSMRPGSTMAAARAPVASPDAAAIASARASTAGDVVAIGPPPPTAAAAPPPDTTSKSIDSWSEPGSTGAAATTAHARAPTDALGRGEPGLADLAHRRDRVLGPLPDERRQAVDQRPELVLPEQPDDLLAVVLPHPAAGRVQGHADVAHEPHQLTALEHGLAVLLERDPKLLRHDLLDVRVQRVERLPRRDQLRGRLLAHARDARDVVGGVALERLVVEHLLGPQAPPLLDLREVVGDRVRDAAAERDHQLGVLADELEHVEVAGEDRRVEAEGLGLADERGDRVVGLEPLLLVLGDVHGPHDLLHLGDLLPHVVGHAGAGGLVLRVAVVAEGARREVEGDRHPVGLHVLDRAQDDVREPEHRGHELALRRRQGLLDEGVVAAVDEPVAVEQEEAFHRLRACGWGHSKCTRANARSGHGWTRDVHARPSGERLRSAHALSTPRRDPHRRRRQPGPQRRDPRVRQGRDRHLRDGGRRLPGRVPRPGRGPQACGSTPGPCPGS